MSGWELQEFSQSSFSGQAPLFPLPNVVLFPQALLPLHVFEQRYREMTEAVLQGERLIAMALLKSREELPSSSSATRNADSSSSDALFSEPPIHDVVGLGRIVGHHRLEDGRYQIVLRGVSRARVVRELPTQLPYRMAQLEILPDHPAQVAHPRRLARRLRRRFEEAVPAVREHTLWQVVRQHELPLGVLCDLLASSLPVAPDLAQHFLADCDVASRYRALMAVLDRLGQRSSVVGPVLPFPPAFSLN